MKNFKQISLKDRQEILFKLKLEIKKMSKKATKKQVA